MRTLVKTESGSTFGKYHLVQTRNAQPFALLGRCRGRMKPLGLWAWFKSLWIPRISAWVVLHTDETLLLGRRSGLVKRPHEWNFLGGRIDPGEFPVEAARREVFEESGLDLDPNLLRPLGRIGGNHYFAYRIATECMPGPTREMDKFAHFKWKHMPKKLHSKTRLFVKHHKKHFKSAVLTAPTPPQEQRDT